MSKRHADVQNEKKKVLIPRHVVEEAAGETLLAAVQAVNTCDCEEEGRRGRMRGDDDEANAEVQSVSRSSRGRLLWLARYRLTVGRSPFFVCFF